MTPLSAAAKSELPQRYYHMRNSGLVEEMVIL